MLEPLSTSSPGIDLKRLAAVATPLAHAHGAEIVDYEWKREPGGWVLRVFVEKLGSAEGNLPTEAASVDLGLCAKVARDLSPALDVADFIPHHYHLEVSTPGVERPLRTKHDYVRFEGRKAKLRLVRPAASGQKVLTGILGPVTGESVRVTECGGDARPHDIVLEDIGSAHLVFEFGPSPKPGKKKK
jgi:ribosome maturation factor RimP